MFNITKETVVSDDSVFKFFMESSVSKQADNFTIDNILDEFNKLGVVIMAHIYESVQNYLGYLVSKGKLGLDGETYKKVK